MAIAAAPELLDISIVEIAGRPGHQGFFPIQGLPIQGTTAIARVRLDGSAAGVTLNVRADNLLSKLPMLVPAEGSAVEGTYFAEFTVPSGPFSLTASGIDSSGTSFEVPAASAVATIAPQTLDVRVIPTVAELAPGLPAFFTVQVTNRGAAGTMTVALTSDAAGGTVTPPSTALTLDTQQTKGVAFTFTPPSTEPTLTPVTMKATALRTTSTGSQNEASLRLFISPTQHSPLVAWPNPNARLGATDKDPTFVWICNGNINVRTIVLAHDLGPDSTKTVSRQEERSNNGEDTSNPNRNSCTASSLLKVAFDTKELRSALATTVFPSQVSARGQLITVPISAFALDGTKLVGYIPLR